MKIVTEDENKVTFLIARILFSFHPNNPQISATWSTDRAQKFNLHLQKTFTFYAAPLLTAADRNISFFAIVTQKTPGKSK